MTKKLTPEQEFEAMLAELDITEEEKNELRRMSGMNSRGGDALPVLKVNTQEDPDKEGVAIPKGNFVINQVVNADETLEKAGVDLGKEVTLTIFAKAQQYSRYHKDPKERCNSNLIFDRNDVAVGSNFGFQCKSGDCPWRAEGVDDKLKCKCQSIAYSALEDGTKVISYHKKSNVIPFENYLKSLGALPPYAAKTKFTTERKKSGQVVYWVINPVKGDMVAGIALKENIQLALETAKGIKAYEASKPKANANSQIEYNPNAGKNAKIVESDSDISFD